VSPGCEAGSQGGKRKFALPEVYPIERYEEE